MSVATIPEVQKSNLASVLLNQELIDVTFEIGNEDFGIKEFHGIRALFAAQSDVLKTMLYGNMIESSIDNKVIINDIHPCGFEWFQSYCYGIHNVKITHENIGYILHICDKYCMKQCYTACLNRTLKDFITNIEYLLHILRVLSELSLAKIIGDILTSDEFGQLTEKQCRQLLLTDKFYFLPPRVVDDILFNSKQNFLQIANQYNLFLLLKHYCQFHRVQSKSLCKDNENNGLNSNDSETKDDDIKEPPQKRRRVVSVDESNPISNNNSNNDRCDHDWTRMMREYFSKHFDFLSMNLSFFMKYIYHSQPSLLTTDEKLEAFEKFAQDMIGQIEQTKISMANEAGMNANDTVFGDRVSEFKFDDNSRVSVTLFTNETPFGESRMYRIESKNWQRGRAHKLIANAKDCIDNETGYYICNFSLGTTHNNLKAQWGKYRSLEVGVTYGYTDIISTPIPKNTYSYYMLCQNNVPDCFQIAKGQGFGKSQEFSKQAASNMWMIKMIFDVRHNRMYFYSVSKFGDLQLITTVTIPKNDGQKLYPFLYSFDGYGSRSSCVFVETTVAQPFWPIVLPST